MPRTAMPDRRVNETREIIFEGKPYLICVGFDAADRPREVFVDGPKYGSTMQAFIADACIVISIALQHGIAPEELARSLGSVPAYHGGQKVDAHASPVGHIMEALQG